MPKNHSIEVYTILAAGATKSFDVADNIEIYEIDANGGAVTLLGNMVFQSTGTPKRGTQFTFLYGGGVTLGGMTMSFFGINMTDAQALGEMLITCYYNGTSWEVRFFADITSGLAEISGNNIVDATITSAKLVNSTVALSKMAVLAARGYAIRGGVNGALEGFNAVTSGNLVMGNGTDVVSQAMTGDVTISGTGVTTIGAGKVTTSMLNFTIAPTFLEVTRTLTSAEILALRTTEINLITAPGANKYINVINVSAVNNYNSTTYNAGADLLNIEINGVAVWTFPNSFVEATADVANQGTRVADAAVAINTDVKARMSSADPTTGNGTITLKVKYEIIDVL